MSALDPITWSMLRALRAGAHLSRNKHFELYEDPRFRRARRLHVFLRSIARDLQCFPDEVEVERIGAGDPYDYALRIEFRVLRGHRTCFLTRLELELLGEEAPEVARRIEALLGEQGPPR